MVYAVNDAYKIAPWANILYAADHSWWQQHKGASDFQGKKYSVSSEACAEYKDIHYIAGKSAPEWSVSPDYIATGGNSGFQAMNLAAIHGAKKIILLGFDYGFKAGTPKHFFGDHPGPINRGSDYPQWIDRINKAALHIKIPVVNCSRETAITCFPRQIIQDALC